MKFLVFIAFVLASVAAREIQWKLSDPPGLRPSHYNIYANDNAAGAAGGVKFPAGPGTGSLLASYDKPYHGHAVVGGGAGYEFPVGPGTGQVSGTVTKQMHGLTSGGVGAGISYPVGKNTDIYAQGSVSKTEHFPSNYQGMVGIKHRF